jgi:hypothetical protein
LRDEHAVERIPMQIRKLTQNAHVMHPERQLSETLVAQLRIEILWRVKLAEGALD